MAQDVFSMTLNEALYQSALKAIRELFGDQSVTQVETAENLQSLIEEIETLQATLSPEGDEGLVPDVRMPGSNTTAKWTMELPEDMGKEDD